MMPVQLIDAPNNSGAGAEGIQSFNNVLQQIAERKRLEEQQAAEMLMKRQIMQQNQEEHQRQLRASAIDEIMKYKDNPEMARLAASKYGVDLGTEFPQAGPAPQAPMQQPAQPQPMQLQDLMDMNLPGAAAAVPTIHVNEPTTITAAPLRQTPNAGQPDPEHLAYAHQILTHDNKVSQDADNVEQFKQAQDLVNSGGVPSAPSPIYHLSFPGGSPLSIDTGALKAAEETSKAQRIKDLEPIIGHDKGAMDIARMVIATGGDDEAVRKALIDTGKMSARLENRIDLLDRQMADRLAVKREFETTAEQKNANAEKMAGLRQTTMESQDEARKNAAAARASSVVNQYFAAADRMTDWKGFTALDNNTRQFIDDIRNPTALDHRAATLKFGSMLRNGQVPQEGEMQLLMKGLGGTTEQLKALGERILGTGDLPSGVKQMFDQAAVHARQQQDERWQRTQNALRTLAKNPTYREVLPQINSILEAHAQQVGRNFAPISPEEVPHGNPSAVLLGGGNSRRVGGGGPTGGQETQQQSTPSGPTNKKPVTITPEDQQMLQKAKADLANPNTPPAKKAGAKRLIDAIEADIARMAAGQ